jgi:hypothetical protein
MEAALIHSLQQDRLLAERVERLMSIPAIGGHCTNFFFEDRVPWSW